MQGFSDSMLEEFSVIHGEASGLEPEILGLAPDGFLLPPPQLRLLGDGRNEDVAGFLEGGEPVAGSLRAAVAAMGGSVDVMGAILDFGCGCGRVARHWSGLAARVHGIDFRADRVEWCDQSLPFMTTGSADPAPPLPYEPASFDLIYALSAFSHMLEPLQRVWVKELRRLLAPGGLLVVSLLGEGFRYRLGPGKQRVYDEGELVVETPLMARPGECIVYHPPPYVADHLLAGFEDVRRFHLGPLEWLAMQDAYIARRPLES
jgi:SAM-dependent methyltransferase